MLSSEVVAEDYINIPGGYIVRVSFKNSIIDVFETVPIPGLNLSQTESMQTITTESQPAITTTSTTVTTTSSTTREGILIELSAGREKTPISLPIPGVTGITNSMEMVETTVTTTTTGTATPAKPIIVSTPQRLSKITFMSEKGMCDIYLDGQQKLELPIGNIDELAKSTIYDVKPSTYLLKIVGFELWYEGKLKVGSGEEVKIRVEPESFKIIGRNPL